MPAVLEAPLPYSHHSYFQRRMLVLHARNSGLRSSIAFILAPASFELESLSRKRFIDAKSRLSPLGCGDHDELHVPNDVSRHVHARNARSFVALAVNATIRAVLASQDARETRAPMRGRVKKERRPRQGAAGFEDDLLELPPAARKMRNRLLENPNVVSRQAFSLRWRQSARSVRAQRYIVAPRRQRAAHLIGALPAPVYGQAAVFPLPAVAVRTMKHAGSVQPLDAAQWREFIHDPGSKQQFPAAFHASPGNLE